MKVLWCWRCGMDVPMLDEQEFETVFQAHQESLRRFRSPSREGGPASLEAVMAPMCAEYTRLTGFPETNANAVFHHRLSLYGPPCASCGKPLRTPQARYCAACGAVR